MDLDDEELKATRRMNCSDKDVGSMKQYINKLIEELTNVRPNELSTEGLKLFNKINEIIDKNKELEEENMQLEAIKDEAIRRYNFESIPVSLVKEKIEELKTQRRELGFKTYLRREDMLNDDRKIVREIEVLQELLEKR